MSLFSFFQEKIQRIIDREGIDTIIVGYSGGADSQFLLQCAKNINIDKIAIHINHGISDNANEWESFCHEQAFQAKFESISFKLNFKDVEGNVEKKAREKRYEIFKKHAKGKTLLLTGHHMDDQAETVLMRIFRGTGLDGLEGIPELSEQQGLLIFRPLLDIDKETIIKTLKNEGISWVEDESNQESEYDRNFIRNKVMPLIKERWGSAPKNISNLSSICKKENQAIKERTKELYDLVSTDNTLNLEKLKELKSSDSENVIRYFFKINGAMAPSKKQMNSIFEQIVLSNSNGKVLFKDFSIQKYNNKMYFVQKHQSLISFGKNFTFDVTYLHEISKNTTIRHNGMTKKVHKLFQEQKIEPWLRNTVPIAILEDKVIGVGNIIKSDDCPFTCDLFDFS